MLHSIKPEESNAMGINGIILGMLKYALPGCMYVLLYVINCCLQNSVVPAYWEKALITPLPKNNKVKSVNDLRPDISVLPIVNKIFKKIIHNEIMNILNLTTCFLVSNRRLEKINNWYEIKNIDEKKLVNLGLLDYLKALMIPLIASFSERN